MSTAEMGVLERYRELAIVHLSYPQPTLLTRALHEAEACALHELPEERFALISSFQNLSWSGEYGPEEMTGFYRGEEFGRLRERLVSVVRYHVGSLTSMIQTMSAYRMLHDSSSNFAPDLDSALRLCRRAVDRRLASCEA